MNISAPNLAGRIDTENFLAGPCRDFSAAYMAVTYLTSHIENYPETINRKTIKTLTGVISSDRFNRQKQIFFLYSEAAQALVRASCTATAPVSNDVIPQLLSMINNATGKRLRALSQALGTLPVTIENQTPAHPMNTAPMDITLSNLSMSMTGYQVETYHWKGRSLVVASGNKICGIIKFAREQGDPEKLVREIMWMEKLNTDFPHPDIDVPRPFKIKNRVLYKITGKIPEGGPATIFDNICIAFNPCNGYYDYPNTHTGQLDCNRLKATFFKNAEYLGRLARNGIVHTALIPLFHNRVQGTRRNDNGLYLWEHGGRLDQWLDSCAYPNFAVSGPRDFEHLELSHSAEQLRHYIGEYLMSFILVMGSCFRNQSPLRRGKDENNHPSDTRDLFHPALFSELVEGVCSGCFQGLTRRSCPADLTLAPQALIQSLIDAMGRDEHMEEVLRARDQDEMTGPDFKRFLMQRGVYHDLERGKADIVIDTGPHLGGFNRPISVPDLIDHLFRFSAFCVAHLHLRHQDDTDRKED